MNIRVLGLAAALGFGAGIWIVPQVMAQPEWDTVKVNLPYSVILGDKTMPPGDYTIQQMRSDDSNILLFYNGNGMKFETSAMTIPAVGNTDQTPERTTVSLRRIGDDYYFDKIFVQGKDYGYEFPLPDKVKSREKEMTAVSLNATSKSTVTSSTPTSNNTTPAAPPAPPVAAITPAPPTPTPTPDVVTPPTPEPQPAPDLTPAPPAPTVSDEGSANREKRPSSDDSAPAMPATSAGWLAMLLSGGALSGAGMMLRRKR